MLEMNLTSHPGVDLPPSFLGEVDGTAFITYERLRQLAKIDTGVSRDDIGKWLKCDINGTILYVAKTLPVTGTNWDYLNRKKLLFGDTLVWIQGEGYKLRVPRAALTDPTNYNRGYAPSATVGSEWDLIFYPLVRDSDYIPNEFRNPNAPYSQKEFMGMDDVLFETICQETRSTNSNHCAYRGFQDVAYAVIDIDKDRVQTYDSWRPILEHIEGSSQWARPVDLEMEQVGSVNKFTATDYVNIKEVRIYRCSTPFTVANLPEVYRVITDPQTVLLEEDVGEGSRQHYLFRFISDTTEYIFDTHLFVAMAFYEQSGPGSKYLRYGDEHAGYFGRVPAAQFFTPDEIRTNVGLTKGNTANNNTDWFKFYSRGQVVFISRMPIQTNIDLNTLTNLGITHETKTVIKAGNTYSYRLMSGVNETHLTQTFTGPINTNNGSLTLRSEWNDLMYPVCSETPVAYNAPKWDSLLLTQMGVAGGPGQVTWCQETLKKTDALTAYGRGYSDIGNLYARAPADGGNYNNYGYRPVLVLQ